MALSPVKKTQRISALLIFCGTYRIDRRLFYTEA